MQIRNAVEDDLERFIYLVNNASYSKTRKGSPILNTEKGSCIKYIAKDESQIREFFFRCVLDEEIIVVEEDNIVIAYALVVTKGRVKKVLDFIIQNEYQGKGIGRELATQIIKKTKKEKIKRIELVCNFEGSSIFWKRMGFKEISRGLFEKIL